MVDLVYDGSWVGLLTSVFEVYEKKFASVHIVRKDLYQPGAFSEEVSLVSDEVKALRVWKGLGKILPKAELKKIFSCYLSEIAGIENTILEYVQLVFSTRGAEKAYAEPCVLELNQVAKKVYREKHRMEAFVRFKLTKDAIYYATVSPDFNVLPLITTHFKDRYADQKWLIYDEKRNYGLFYNLEKVEEIVFEVEKPFGRKDVFAENEGLYQNLWRDYFKHVNITERKNSKLHVQHVPKRYWKYLTEKFDEGSL